MVCQRVFRVSCRSRCTVTRKTTLSKFAGREVTGPQATSAVLGRHGGSRERTAIVRHLRMLVYRSGESYVRSSVVLSPDWWCSARSKRFVTNPTVLRFRPRNGNPEGAQKKMRLSLPPPPR